MRINFLEPTQPNVKATKCFTRLPDGTIEKQSFNHVYKVTSHAHDIDTLEAFADQLRENATRGWVLLKGTLNRTLVNESRAGTTNRHDPTAYIVLDCDGIPDITSHTEFVTQCLPPEFHAVDYIWQPSASTGITDQRGFSGHLFFLLDEPIDAPTLKLHLQAINLGSPALRVHTELTAGNVTLRYPLDISACQNDKLIYIAPPVLKGIEDPIPPAERFTVVKRDNRQLHINLDLTHYADNGDPMSPPIALADQIEHRVNELRRELGLRGKKASYKIQFGQHLLTNPDEAQITGPIKRERGFTYLQLNGSPHHCFWFPDNNPSILHSWKGDPPCLLKDILPKFAAQFCDENLGGQYSEQHLVFRVKELDSYFTADLDSEQQTVRAYPIKSKDRMKDYLAQYKLPLPDPIPDWDLVFDPTSDEMINLDEKRLNTFEKSAYIKQAERMAQNTARVSELPPICHRIIWSATGSDQESFNHFLNWLAYIYQYRRKTQTAWVLHGRMEGTGKGLLFNKILSPTLGNRYCVLKQIADINDTYNAWLQECLILFIDESQIGHSSGENRTMELLKSMITEPQRSIRAMHTNPYQKETYFNIIFASNTFDSVQLSDNDRRFNIAKRQEMRLPFSDADERALAYELLKFTQFMLSYNVNIKKATSPLENAAKRELVDLNKTSQDQFFHALTHGDLDFFLEFALESSPDRSSALRHMDLLKLVKKWAKEANQPLPTKIPRSEIYTVYSHIQSDARHPVSPNKFTRIAKLNGLTIKPLRIEDLITRGLEINWRASEDLLDAIQRKTHLASVK